MQQPTLTPRGSSTAPVLSNNPDLSNERVSLDVIAARFKVSKATVCRALRGQPGVSKKLRASIIKTAEELGYYPDPALSALASLRWKPGTARAMPFAVAAIHVRGSPDKSSKAKKASVDRTPGVQKRCGELGIIYDEFFLDDHEYSMRLGRVLKERGFHGIAFSIEGPTTDWSFPVESFACVGIGYDTPAHPIHRVCPDTSGAVHRAVDEAVAHGYRRIGFFNFIHNNPEIDIRNASAMEFRRHQLEQRYGPQPEILTYPIDGHFTDLYEANRERFHRWKKENKPDIVIDSNRIGFWILHMLGVKMPEDIGYISLMGPPRNTRERAVTYTDPQYDLQGRWAADLLVKNMQYGIRGLPDVPVRITVPISWHPGESIRAHADSAASNV